MPYPILAVISGFALVSLWLVIVIVLDTYWRMQSPRVVGCPAAGAPAAVQLKPAGAAGSARVARCSRWPLHAGCDQGCIGRSAAEDQPIL